MKLSVRVRGDWLAIPCRGTELVRWLGEEAIRRHRRVTASLPSPPTGSGALQGGAVGGNGTNSHEAEGGENGGLEKKEGDDYRLMAIRRASGGSILDFDDQIEMVLDDNAFVLVGMSDLIMLCVQLASFPSAFSLQSENLVFSHCFLELMFFNFKK